MKNLNVLGSSVSFVSLFATALVLTSCLQSQPVEKPNLYPGGKAGAQTNASGASGNSQSNPSTQIKPDGTGTVPVVLRESDLRTYTRNTDNLSYKFSYAGVEKNGAIVFTDGKAELKFSDLPFGKSSDMKLDIVEAAAVKLQGVIKDLTLNQTANDVKMELKPVDPALSNVSISVSLPGAPPTTGSTGSTGGLTFTADVKPLLAAACTECHQEGKRLNFQKFPFTSGDQAAVVDSLLTSVSGASASMPPSPRTKLTAAQIEVITKWKSGGLKP